MFTDLTTELFETLRALWMIYFGFGVRVAPIFLLTAAIISFFVWRVEKPGIGFFAWLMPKSIYFHQSTWVDVKIYAFKGALAFAGVFALLSVTPLIALGVIDWLVQLTGAHPASEATYETWQLALAVLLILMAYDLGTYWTHRLHHEFPVLWPFHSVHHSAEVMTPLTAYRTHPLYDAILIVIRGVLGGAVQAFVLFFIVGALDLSVLGKISLVYFFYNLLGANLRHSHVWLRFGPAIEHVLSSPAQHQIHHSIAPEHWNKNYAEVFSFWDWIFGTLYIPKEREHLVFGLADETGQRIEQLHPTLKSAVLRPFADSYEAARERLPRASRGSPADRTEQHAGE